MTTPVERRPKYLVVFSVPLSVTALTVFAFIGVAAFVSGIIFTAVGNSISAKTSKDSKFGFMRALGPALLATGFVTASVCGLCVFVARRNYSKRGPPVRRRTISASVQGQVQTEARSSSSLQRRPHEPASLVQQSTNVYEEVHNVPTRPSYRRSYSNERLETIRPPRPLRQYQRQPTPPGEDEVPPSYDEVMEETVIAVTTN